MPVIDLPQGKLKYRAAGPEDTSQPPVVFIHPILTDGQLWAGVADPLVERGIRSFAPDWPLGSHTIPLHPHADRSPAGVAEMVGDFLTALDLRDVTLVGNNTGGALAQYVLDAGNPRVTRAVLMNCDAFDAFPPFPINAILAPLKFEPAARALAQMMRWTPLRQSWFGFGLLARNLPADLTEAWLMPTRTNVSVRHDVIEFLKAIDPAELLGISHRLGDLTTPITLLWGMDDRSFRPALGRRLANAIGCELVEVPGARTLLALDAPRAVVDAIVTTQKMQAAR